MGHSSVMDDHFCTERCAAGLRRPQRKEREEKESLFPKATLKSKLFWGLSAQHERQLLSVTPVDGKGGFSAAAGMARGLGEGVGEQSEFLLNTVTTTGIVTKSHFHNHTGQELSIASPW